MVQYNLEEVQFEKKGNALSLIFEHMDFWSIKFERIF